MTASLETLVVAAYVFAHSLSSPRPGPEGKISDAELVAFAVAQAATGVCSDGKFLGMIGDRLGGWFPICPTNRNTTGVCAGSRPRSRSRSWRSPS
jgi:hypothetical protein